MDIRKGISYVAFGFLFTLVNFNLTMNGLSINITPDFVGWILLFLAHDKLGTYVENKAYLKWMALILAIFSATLTLLGYVSPGLNVSLFKSMLAVISVVYMFILFGVLEKIAADNNTSQAKTISILKILNLALYVAFVVCVLLTTQNLEVFATLSLVFGAAAIISAIFTVVVLFKLRKEIKGE